MTDLNSPAIQSLFKRTARVSLVTRIIMGGLTILSAALAIWMATRSRQIRMDWSITTFIVLLSLASACFIGMFIWTVLTGKPYSTVLYKYITEGFYSHEKFLNTADTLIEAGLTVEFTLMLIGNKLTVFLAGTEDLVQFDLEPIKNYFSACASTVAYAKQFILAYCGVKASEHGDGQVSITDSIGKPKTLSYTVAEGGYVSNFLVTNYFLKQGLIK